MRCSCSMDGKQHVQRGIRDDEGTASSHMTAYLFEKSESVTVTVIQESESEALYPLCYEYPSCCVTL